LFAGACKSLALRRGILLFRGANVSGDPSMTALTRRSFLATTAAGLATTAAGLATTALPAFAAPTTFKHGVFEVTVVSDGHLVLPVSFLATDAPDKERDAVLK